MKTTEMDAIREIAVREALTVAIGLSDSCPHVAEWLLELGLRDLLAASPPQINRFVGLPSVSSVEPVSGGMELETLEAVPPVANALIVESEPKAADVPLLDYETQKAQAVAILEAAMQENEAVGKEECIRRIVEQTGLTEREAGIRYNDYLHKQCKRLEQEDKAASFGYMLNHPQHGRGLPGGVTRPRLLPEPEDEANVEAAMPPLSAPVLALTRDEVAIRLDSDKPYEGLIPGTKPHTQVRNALYHRRKQTPVLAPAYANGSAQA